jgi:hypothetical protein
MTDWTEEDKRRMFPPSCVTFWGSLTLFLLIVLAMNYC